MQRANTILANMWCHTRDALTIPIEWSAEDGEWVIDAKIFPYLKCSCHGLFWQWDVLHISHAHTLCPLSLSE